MGSTATHSSVRGKSNLQFWTNIRNLAQIDTSVLDAKEFVHHSLVRPLRQHGRDRVVSPIKDEE